MVNSAWAPLRMLCAAIVAAAIPCESAPAAEYELVSTVIFSRHGVRSPIGSGTRIEEVAADPWPSWPTEHPGDLTERGAELVKLMGVYYREDYAAKGLFPAEGCPQPGAVSVWADVDQRTRLTAQALVEGMFPGCSVAVGHLVGAKVDPLFHPGRAGVCLLDPARARTSMLRRAGGSLGNLQKKFKTEIAALQSVLKCCAPAMCRPAGAAACTLADLPSELTVGDEGSRIRLSGPIGIGSMASEVFLLQYAQGFPATEVGWGRAATPQAIQPLMRLHVLRFDLIDRAPYLAARQGSPVVDRIVAALRRAAEAPASAPKMTLIVGHDDNIANIGGMLGLHWLLPSYLMDQTPPAGALHFELLREKGRGALAVRVSYVAQSLDQMRNATPLSRANPPESAVAAFERCRMGRDRACPWPRFARLANQAIDRACVPATPQ